MKVIFILLHFLFCLANSQAQKQSGRRIELLFQNKVGDSALQSGGVYHNVFDEEFTVRKLQFYISHIELQYTDGKHYAINKPPHLIDEHDSTSKHLSLIVPSGNIREINFLLGVDSATNVSGVQFGDLDPAKGMFWVWNTGYIMAKLEGSSPASKAPGKRYEYDIGGYKPGENAAREVRLTLPLITSHQPSTFIITADLSKWFQNKSSIRIGEQPLCHAPGKLAMQVADNYASMFSISAQ